MLFLVVDKPKISREGFAMSWCSQWIRLFSWESPETFRRRFTLELFAFILLEVRQVSFWSFFDHFELESLPASLLRRAPLILPSCTSYPTRLVPLAPKSNPSTSTGDDFSYRVVDHSLWCNHSNCYHETLSSNALEDPWAFLLRSLRHHIPWNCIFFSLPVDSTK